MDELDNKKINAGQKAEPPRLADYRILPESDYNKRQINSAPEIGGLASILAEFDAATRSDQYSQALRKLIQSRQNIIPELLVRLETDDVNLARKAAIALGYMRSPQAIINLVKAAQMPERQLHWHATSALSCIGGTEAVNCLINMLNHRSIQVQAAAAKALGKNGLPAAPSLVEALKRSDDLVRIHAAHSLGQINSPLAVPTLIQALTDPVKAVRFEAAWALAQIRSPLASKALAERLTDNDLSVQSQAAQALKSIGAPAIPALADMLKNNSSNTRSVAARTLGQMGIEEVIPLLVNVLKKDNFPYVRCDAAIALGEIGSHECVFHLSSMLKDGDRSVRNAAVRALRQINTPEATEVLRLSNQTVAVPGYSISNAYLSEDTSDFTILQ